MKRTILFLSLIISIMTANAQWTSQSTGFAQANRGLSEIHIVDANTVWALAYDGDSGATNIQQCTLTLDGGVNWTPRNIALGDPAIEINNICPISGSTAWLSAVVPTDGNGTVFKTTDGGVTWNPQTIPGFSSLGSSFLIGVYFWNANVGVAYGQPVSGEFEIFRTTDGGATWTAVPGVNIANPLNGENGYNSVPTAVGESLWFPTNKGRLIRTIDMGLTWTARQGPLNDFGSALPGESGTIAFSTENNGCLLKTSGTIATPVYTYYTTTNGGQTWSTGTAFSGTRRILTYVPRTNTLVATSQETPIGTSVSTDNGTSWTNVESGAQRGVSAFLNLTTGWAAGFTTTSSSDGIFKLTGQLETSNPTAANKFKIYPNPVSSLVTISTPDVEVSNLSISDLTGKVVLKKSLIGIENTIDISELSNGIYFLEINSDAKKEVVKILKN